MFRILHSGPWQSRGRLCSSVRYKPLDLGLKQPIDLGLCLQGAAAKCSLLFFEFFFSPFQFPPCLGVVGWGALVPCLSLGLSFSQEGIAWVASRAQLQVGQSEHSHQPHPQQQYPLASLIVIAPSYDNYRIRLRDSRGTACFRSVYTHTRQQGEAAAVAPGQAGVRKQSLPHPSRFNIPVPLRPLCALRHGSTDNSREEFEGQNKGIAPLLFRVCELELMPHHVMLGNPDHDG